MNLGHFGQILEPPPCPRNSRHRPRPLLAAKFHSDRFEPGELKGRDLLRGDDVWVYYIIRISLQYKRYTKHDSIESYRYT